MKIKNVQDLELYQIAVRLQQVIFVASKQWPKEETYSLIDQVRRSSRSIGANLSEAWAKRGYPAHFLSKLTDADAELAETRHWIATAIACSYLTDQQKAAFIDLSDTVGRMIGAMILKSDQFCLSDGTARR